MRSEHAIQVEYPIAGSDDGLPVIVTFTYEKAGLLESVDFKSVRLANPDWRLPDFIMKAIEDWAQAWLDDDDGNSCACDTAYHDIERQRESARDMGMVRS